MRTEPESGRHVPSRSVRARLRALPVVAAVLSALVISACTTTDDDPPSDDTADVDATPDDQDPSDGQDTPDESPDGQDTPEDAGADPDLADEGPEEREPPVTTIRLFPVDAPETTAEIRVGEIIIEFDGEVTDDGTLLTLEEPILFAFDSAQLKGGARTTLDDIAEVLDYYAGAPIEVIGHTDDRGSAEYNLDLSQRRADAVVAALVERGIDSGRITADGRGLTEPVASNDTDEGRARNRRVEVLIVGVEPPEGDG